VGKRLRLRRTLLGLSQEKLSESVGLTFQQIQKYERGANRIGASRLFQFSQILDVPIGFFFEGLSAAAAGRQYGMAEEGAGYTPPPGTSARRDALELLRLYNSIEAPSVRRHVLALVKSVVRSGKADEK
jgi:transcriptional regulator with XRE-family HTH domain